MVLELPDPFPRGAEELNGDLTRSKGKAQDNAQGLNQRSMMGEEPKMVFRRGSDADIVEKKVNKINQLMNVHLHGL